MNTKTITKSAKNTADRITGYLQHGGLFNPESMDHNNVRDLLIECREVIGKQLENHVRIYSRCPSCHNDTLAINEGHLLCTWHECKNPTLIDDIGFACICCRDTGQVWSMPDDTHLACPSCAIKARSVAELKKERNSVQAISPRFYINHELLRPMADFFEQQKYIDPKSEGQKCYNSAITMVVETIEKEINALSGATIHTEGGAHE